jgi:crotonobetainyl-CoA:carnitine CoA-transferase CaiB-like acyl-CoA transferase
MLADLGADVLKIEPPGGDLLRKAGQGGAMFAHLNRGKRGAVIDLKTPRGQQELKRLAADADVLVHNSRPDAAARLGLRRSDLASVNARLIVACAFGYGADFVAGGHLAGLSFDPPRGPPYYPRLMPFTDPGVMSAGYLH